LQLTRFSLFDVLKTEKLLEDITKPKQTHLSTQEQLVLSLEQDKLLVTL